MLIPVTVIVLSPTLCRILNGVNNKNVVKDIAPQEIGSTFFLSANL